MPNPDEILSQSLTLASSVRPPRSTLSDDQVQLIENVCNCNANRAGTRLVLSCLLAKIHQSSHNATMPYTEIGDAASFSGRTYDEQYLTKFISDNDLPCNNTTAYLTPALRNIGAPLARGTEIVGRPRHVYIDSIEILNQIQDGVMPVQDAFVRFIWELIRIRNANRARMSALLEQIGSGDDNVCLSVESIVTLMRQHLSSPHSSRLPVLMVAAAYRAARDRLGGDVADLLGHNAADLQTNAIGDVEFSMVGEDRICTAFEMKARSVSVDDIDHAIEKIAGNGKRINNYIFITTDPIAQDVIDYAEGVYSQTGGIEVVIFDCLEFVRHFLHIFSRYRISYLNEYQKLVLAEPASAVSQALKEVFLALRQAAEADS